MQHNEFREVVEKFLASRTDLLFTKNQGYNPEADALRAFKYGAAVEECTPEQELWGMFMKHFISVHDAVKDGKARPEEWWDEKLGDFVNYMLLLRGLIIDTGALDPNPPDNKLVRPNLPLGA